MGKIDGMEVVGKFMGERIESSSVSAFLIPSSFLFSLAIRRASPGSLLAIAALVRQGS